MLNWNLNCGLSNFVVASGVAGPSFEVVMDTSGPPSAMPLRPTLACCYYMSICHLQYICPALSVRQSVCPSILLERSAGMPGYARRGTGRQGVLEGEAEGPRRGPLRSPTATRERGFHFFYRWDTRGLLPSLCFYIGCKDISLKLGTGWLMNIEDWSL